MIRILDSTKLPLSEILDRKDGGGDVFEAVDAIIDNVRKNGDAALFEYSRRFDRAELSRLEVTKSEIDAAYASQPAEFIEILEQAAANIRAYHEKQLNSGFEFERDGIILGQRVLPVRRAGIYVPGGTAAYPSTVLMDCVPAKLAGVPEVIMVTPPTNGSVNPAILAAAKVAGVDRVFSVGGAQAIAALAYGTESIPAVDKIVGPGNKYVAAAKARVRGVVDIDMIAGPSEILIIADETFPPEYAAADLLSQAEHDVSASAVLITNSEKLAAQTQKELEAQLPHLSRESIARKSIDDNGKIIIVPSLRSAAEISDALAPEHLELAVAEPFELMKEIHNAGSIFLGAYTPEPLGDYFAGPNHTLPTSGTARFSSPLSVDDFVKKTQYIRYSRQALNRDAEMVEYFAEKEGLTAHAAAVAERRKS